MFYCEDCRIKNDWPKSLGCSRGPCEICGKTAICYDEQSEYLPIPKDLINAESLRLGDLLISQFEKNGTGPNYNCWNLCREVYRRAGRVLPEYGEYISELSDRDNLINTVKSEDFVLIDNPEPLAIVTFQLRPHLITHMGVMIDKRRFIHIRKHGGCAVERIDTGAYSRKIEGFYRYAGTD